MKNLRNDVVALWRFLRSTPRAANLFALATLLLWLFKVLYLDRIPGPFRAAYDIGRVFEGILSSIIAAWVFYLFFGLLPEEHRKSHITPFVLQSIASIVGDTNSILQEVAKASGETLPFGRVSERRLARAFAKVSFNAPTTVLVDLSGRHATWLEFFRMRRERTRQRIAEVKEMVRYVSPDATALILSIGHNGFFTMAETTEHYAAARLDLGSFAGEFYKFLMASRELATWHDANLVSQRAPILPSLG